MCRMKARNHDFKQRFNEARQVLDAFLKLAPTKKRNYIMDQTNLSAFARKDKLSFFLGPSATFSFTVHAEVFVSPTEVCDCVYNFSFQFRGLYDSSPSLRLKSDFVLFFIHDLQMPFNSFML